MPADIALRGEKYDRKQRFKHATLPHKLNARGIMSRNSKPLARSHRIPTVTIISGGNTGTSRVEEKRRYLARVSGFCVLG